MKYYASDVEKVTGLNQPHLRKLIERGFINPERHTHGKGYRNIFTEQDICKILLFQRLVRNGFKNNAAGKLIFEQAPMLLTDAYESIPELQSQGRLPQGDYNIGEMRVAYFRTRKGKPQSHFSVDKKAFSSLYDKIDDIELLVLVNLSKLKKEVRKKLESLKP